MTLEQGIVLLALLLTVVWIMFDMVRFHRIEREWKRRDAEFWDRLERTIPGIKDQFGRK